MAKTVPHQVAIADCPFAVRFLNSNGTRYNRLKRVSAVVEARFPKRYREACYLNGGSVINCIKLLKTEYPMESLSELKARMDAMAPREERQLRWTYWENNRAWAVALKDKGVRIHA